MNNLAFGCADVEELAGAYALGAMEADESRVVAEHLSACREPHAELRELLPLATLMLADPEFVSGADAGAPSPATRSRLMRTIASIPQEHRATPRVAPAPARAYEPAPEPRAGFFDWLRPRAMGAVAAVALLAAVGLGAWNLQLRSALDGRDEQLAQVASTIAAGGPAYRVEGSAGSGYLVEREDGSAAVILGSLEDLSQGERYQMWLLTEEELVTAGSFTATDDDLVIVALDRPVGDFTTFAVSVETQPVETPSADPVMVAALES